MIRPEFIWCLLIILTTVSTKCITQEENKRPVEMAIYNVIDMPSNIDSIKTRVKMFLKELNIFTDFLTSGNYSFGVSLCGPIILNQIVGLSPVESANDVNNQIQASIDKSRTNQVGLITGLNESLPILESFRDSDNSALLISLIYVGKPLRPRDWPELNRLYRRISHLSYRVYFINISGNEMIKSEFEANDYEMFDLLDVLSLNAKLEVFHERKYGGK